MSSISRGKWKDWANSGMRNNRGRPTNRSSDTYAQDTRAWLRRSEWADYQNRYLPVEQQLIDETMGTELLEQRLSAISGNVDDSFSSAGINASDTRGRYGIQPSAQASAAHDRTMALDKSTSTANARNNTRTAIFDRNMSTTAGGASVANASRGT